MRIDAHTQIRRILGADYLALEVVHYRVAEYVGAETGCQLSMTLCHRAAPDQRETVEARGVGVVDAIYHGLVQHFSRRFESLATLAFVGFEVRGQMTGAVGRAGLDAEAEVSLAVTNGHGRQLRFVARGRSTVAAALAAVLQVVEHFVNAERAFVTLHRALVDARGRRRPDLVEQFTAELAMLVDNTCYVDLSERLRA